MNLYNKYKNIIDNFISNDIHNINNYNVKDPLISIILLYSLENKFNNQFNKIIAFSLVIESVVSLIKEYSINNINEFQYIQKLMKYNQLIINYFVDIIKNNFDNKFYNGFTIINNYFDILNNNFYKSNINLISCYQSIFEMALLLIWNLMDNDINNMINYKLTGNYLGVLYKIYIDIDEQDNMDISLNMFKLNDTKELMEYYMNYQEQFLNFIFKIKLFNNNNNNDIYNNNNDINNNNNNDINNNDNIIDNILYHLSNNINLIS